MCHLKYSSRFRDRPGFDAQSLSCRSGAERSNMAFAGAFTPVFAKHSKSFSLIDCISVGVDRMQRNFDPMRKLVEASQRWVFLAGYSPNYSLPLCRSYAPLRPRWHRGWPEMSPRLSRDRFGRSLLCVTVPDNIPICRFRVALPFVPDWPGVRLVGSFGLEPLHSL
jgi:hypothetical protein